MLKRTLIASSLFLAGIANAASEAPKVPVNLDNFVTAESHFNFERIQARAGGINGVTADYNSDGSVTIQLGGCEAGTPNCLPTPGEGWYYQWRMYDPGEEFRRGEFRFNTPVAKR